MVRDPEFDLDEKETRVLRLIHNICGFGSLRTTADTLNYAEHIFVKDFERADLFLVLKRLLENDPTSTTSSPPPTATT
jgi:hypothetical protein